MLQQLQTRKSPLMSSSRQNNSLCLATPKLEQPAAGPMCEVKELLAKTQRQDGQANL